VRTTQSAGHFGLEETLGEENAFYDRKLRRSRGWCKAGSFRGLAPADPEAAERRMNLLVGGLPGGATRFRQARQPKQLYGIIAEKFGGTALCRPLFDVPCTRNAHYVATLFEQQNRGNHDVCSAREPHARRW
jgi:hypothetical protein